MKKHAILTAIFIALIAMIALPEQAAAQARRRARVKVVKRHTTVVRFHPRVVRRAHVRYAHLPRWGAAVAVAPVGAVIIRSTVYTYHFHNGIFYAPRNNQLVVVRPVPGIRIAVLPVGYRRIVIRSKPYFYYYGTFYTRIGNKEEYEVVDAPEGAIVDALPDGYEIKTIKGTEYYYLDGVYYAEVDSDEVEGGTGYQVVKI